jgi:hypothetical protein
VVSADISTLMEPQKGNKMSDKLNQTEVTANVTEKTAEVAKPKAVKKPVKKIVKVSQEAAPAVVSSPASTADASKNRFQPQGRVKLIQGSILSPHNAGLRFVLNVANLGGKPESPLYSLFDKKWPKVKQEVRGWFVTKTGAYKLGAVHTMSVQSDIWILSLLIQDDELKTDLNAIKVSLKEVCKAAKYEKATVHVSTLLTDLIPEFSDLITEYLVKNNVIVHYYEEPNN